MHNDAVWSELTRVDGSPRTGTPWSLVYHPRRPYRRRNRQNNPTAFPRSTSSTHSMLGSHKQRKSALRTPVKGIAAAASAGRRSATPGFSADVCARKMLHVHTDVLTAVTPVVDCGNGRKRTEQAGGCVGKSGRCQRFASSCPIWARSLTPGGTCRTSKCERQTID